REAGDEITAFDRIYTLLRERIGRADLDFHAFGGRFTDQQIVFGTHILDDILVHFVARDTDAAADDDAAERKDGDLCRAAADVDHHAAAGFLNGQTRAH